VLAVESTIASFVSTAACVSTTQAAGIHGAFLNITATPDLCQPLPGGVALDGSAGVCRFRNGQQRAGTRRVHEIEHARSRAGTADTRRKTNLQDKRVRE
jgi:hypothetical protein